MHTGPNNSTTFASMAEFAEWMRLDRCLSYYRDGERSDKWVGDVNAMQAMAMLKTGDTSRVAMAEQMLAKFDLRIDTIGTVMDTGVAGFSPSVPDYLGGSPESMFCMAEAPVSNAPLKIIVDPTSSAGIEANQLSKRGTTILAAVMALSATRAVTLEIASLLDCGPMHRHGANGNSICIVRVGINSAPLDLGSACYALSHPAFARILLYGAAQVLYESPLAWPAVHGVDMTKTRDADTQAASVALLGGDESDTLFIPAIHLHDEITTNPEKWVHKVLEKYGQPATA